MFEDFTILRRVDSAAESALDFKLDVSMTSLKTRTGSWS